MSEMLRTRKLWMEFSLRNSEETTASWQVMHSGSFFIPAVFGQPEQLSWWRTWCEPARCAHSPGDQLYPGLHQGQVMELGEQTRAWLWVGGSRQAGRKARCCSVCCLLETSFLSLSLWDQTWIGMFNGNGAVQEVWVQLYSTSFFRQVHTGGLFMEIIHILQE